MEGRGQEKGMSVSNVSIKIVTSAEEADDGACLSSLDLETGKAIHCQPQMTNVTVDAHVEGTWR